MKKNHVFYLILLMVTALACSAPQYVQEDERSRDRNDRRVIEISEPITLADYLRRVPGVFLDDSRGYPVVTIRGGLPLFVVDGVRIGNSYMEVAQLVNVQDIASVEVLKSPGETIPYGRQAGNGVIIIRTKTGHDPL